MIEFSEDLSKIYSGKQAVKQRVETRLKHSLSDIPYYDRGIDIVEFTYGSKATAIRQGLRDFSANITVNSLNSRVQIYDVIIDVDKLISQEG